MYASDGYRLGAVSSQVRAGSGNARLPIEVLEELIGRLLDRLVPPLRGAEQHRDDPGPMDPPEVAEDERITRLGPSIKTVVDGLAGGSRLA